MTHRKSGEFSRLQQKSAQLQIDSKFPVYEFANSQLFPHVLPTVYVQYIVEFYLLRCAFCFHIVHLEFISIYVHTCSIQSPCKISGISQIQDLTALPISFCSIISKSMESMESPQINITRVT